MLLQSYISMNSDQLIRSYLPRNRGLNSIKKVLLKEVLPNFQIDIQLIKELDISKKINVEIGSGNGDFISDIASSYQDEFFIASEVYIGGVAKLLAKISSNSIANTKIWPQDGRILLMAFLDNIISNIFILFPDPWPKSRHHKRRLVNQEFINLLADKLRSGGNVYIVTDHKDYAEWIQNNFMLNSKFKDEHSLSFKDSKYFYDIRTKYYLKAKSANKNIHFFCYTRVEV